MPYVDAIFDRKNDKILVAERINGERVLNEFDAEHVFYYAHPAGQHKSIFGDTCKKFSTYSGSKFRKELGRYKASGKVFESDINPIFRALATHYKGMDAPTLNVGFFDIEVDFDPERGFAPVTDPFNKITAISIFHTVDQKLHTMVLIPNDMDPEEGYRIASKFENTTAYTEEAPLIERFLELIEDCDVLSGWNSTFFDIPYIVNRIKRTMGDDATKALCLWGRKPVEREVLKFKREHQTYDLVGRAHLDYLELYQKHNPQQLHSYRLDYVAEIEVKQNKTPYEGTLDTLYHKEFEQFIEYNRQDVLLLNEIDKKKKFIELANQIAHANYVNLKTTMGSVALVEQAIINEMHDMGFVVPDRKERDLGSFDEDKQPQVITKKVTREVEEVDDVAMESALAEVADNLTDDVLSKIVSGMEGESNDDFVRELSRWLNREMPDLYAQLIDQCTVIRKIEEFEEVVVYDDYEDEDGEKPPVVGAYVAVPKKGIHHQIGCVDINSLYPSAIRALNMSPETIVGQIRSDRTKALVDERIASGTPRAEAWEGIFATLEVQTVQNEDPNETITIDFEDGTSRTMTGDKAYEWIFNPKNHVCMTANGTLFRTDKDGMIPLLLAKWYADRKSMQKKQREFEDLEVQETDPIKKAEYKYWAGFWNQRQQARKILLNSLYGALLNEGLRFHDERLGQSTTLSGRSIVRHMNGVINEIITGTYDYRGEGIVYADTDSCYFSAYNVMPSFNWADRDAVIKLYDDIADAANATFPEFMKKSFNTSLERGKIIAAGRELVASKGLFIKKKKYALLNYEFDGQRYDVDGKAGKLKAMGLDLKRADTPKFMQQFLEKLLMDLLTDKTEEQMFADIKKFRIDFKQRPGWEKGTPKKVSALTDYVERHSKVANMSLMEAVGAKKNKKGKLKVDMPGHVRAAMNWNTLCEVNGDKYSMRINDGSKIIVCKVGHNVMKMNAVAYPIDEHNIPSWFKELPFDHEAMEESIIDKKLDNLVGVLDWDLARTKEDQGGAEFFSF